MNQTLYVTKTKKNIFKDFPGDVGFTLNENKMENTSLSHAVYLWNKLQALVYKTRPSTNAITDYAIGLKKLSANRVFRLYQDCNRQLKLHQAFLL